MNTKYILTIGLILLNVSFRVNAGDGTIKVYVLAGDENVLEQGLTAPNPLDKKRGDNVPGTLADVVSRQNHFSFLKGDDGKWIGRKDVVVYDAHRIQNETVAIGKFLSIGKRIGPELMLGHTLGNATEDPVLIVRYGVQSVFHSPGSRSLAHDYRSPSRASVATGQGTWDVIHFNFGVWDSHRIRRDGRRSMDKENGVLRVPLERYEKNLREIVGKLKESDATLIWGTTTPIHKDCPTTRQEDAKQYALVAAKIMKENGVIINDLHAESLKQGYPKRPDVHSVGELGPVVLKAINDALKNRKSLCKPTPRVLIIGDSISSPYTRYVKQELDGKVTVYHNPGNGESSDNGAKRIDQWLDLKSYLLKGQEYLELAEGVKWVIENPKRCYPGYKGEKLELSGMIWFQGIADSRSMVKAKEYEANLSSLISDLRKEWNEPALPVVVVANHHGKAVAGSPMKIIHDAQMAMGNSKKHPLFAHTVMSVDTTPLLRGKEQSPGYFVSPKRDILYTPDRYFNNAESFLLIGEEMGKAMLKLIGERGRK